MCACVFVFACVRLCVCVRACVCIYLYIRVCDHIVLFCSDYSVAT